MKAFFSLLLAILQFNLMGMFGAKAPEPEYLEKTVDSYNYILGTQAISPSYRFTTLPDRVEVAQHILAMGSNMVKIETGDTAVHTVLEACPDFKYIFMWYRKYNLHQAVFYDGFSDAEREEEYNAVYNFTKTLLTKYNNTGKEFYIGNWETDWYYIDGYDTNVEKVDDSVTEAMIDWINTRQKAVDDAKRDTAHENVAVWNYLEVVRVQDAFQKGRDRVVNKVLPYANVDYVSYSSYDCIDLPARKIRKTIDKINDILPDKEGVPGPRVFIGEYAYPAQKFGYDDEKYCKANLEVLQKFLTCNVKFVLFWQMFCNEKQADGTNKGYWLIDNKGNKSALYDAFETILAKGKTFVADYEKQHGFLPSEETYRAYLRTVPELYGIKK